MALEDDTPASAAPAAEAEPTSAGEENGTLLTCPEWAIPRVDDLIIEDGKPVESITINQLMRLLCEALYSSWAGPGAGRTFAVFSDVGLFAEPKQTPLCPDVMLSLDVPVGRDRRKKENNSYFVWSFGKPPDVVIEFVSDRYGGEATHKMQRYAAIRVLYYVIYDPREVLRGEVLQAYHLVHGIYEPFDPAWLPGVGLGLKLWEGEYEGVSDVWLRWTDHDGNVIPTGKERADHEKQQADEAKKLAAEAVKRAERLAEQLRGLGVDPTADNP
jgi:Uma2 family endonuclease